MPTDVTPADREKAREWADREWPDGAVRSDPIGAVYAVAVDAFLAGLAAGRAGLRWTGEAPAVPGWWWFRGGPDTPSDEWTVECIYSHGSAGYLCIVTEDRFEISLASHLREYPACQWSGPITPPQEPT